MSFVRVESKPCYRSLPCRSLHRQYWCRSSPSNRFLAPILIDCRTKTRILLNAKWSSQSLPREIPEHGGITERARVSVPTVEIIGNNTNGVRQRNQCCIELSDILSWPIDCTEERLGSCSIEPELVSCLSSRRYIWDSSWSPKRRLHLTRPISARNLVSIHSRARKRLFHEWRDCYRLKLEREAHLEPDRELVRSNRWWLAPLMMTKKNY